MSIPARVAGGSVSPPISTRVVGTAAATASRAAMYIAAYAAGSEPPSQNWRLSGSFQISSALTGCGVSCGREPQNAPPGPYRRATAAANAA